MGDTGKVIGGEALEDQVEGGRPVKVVIGNIVETETVLARQEVETLWVEQACNAVSHLGPINATPAGDRVVSHPTVEVRRGGVPLIVSDGNILIRVRPHFVQNRIQKTKPSPERTPQHSK